MLHNYLISGILHSHQDPPGYVDHEYLLGNFIPREWRSETGPDAAAMSTVSRMGSNTFSCFVVRNRITFTQYFTSSSGEIVW